MNAKIIIALLCTTQLAAGFDLGSLTSVVSDLQKKAEEVETNVVQKIQNSWNTAVADAKQTLDNFKTQIETEVQKTVDQVRNVTINISECVAAEKDNANKLVEDAKNQLQAYADQEWSAVQALIAKLQDTVNKGKTFASSSTQQIAACASNFFGSLSCYASLAGPILQQAASIGIDIANLAVQSQDAFKIALTDLQTSIKTIGSQTTTQATAIISEAAQCIASRSG